MRKLEIGNNLLVSILGVGVLIFAYSVTEKQRETTEHTLRVLTAMEHSYSDAMAQYEEDSGDEPLQTASATCTTDTDCEAKHGGRY